MVKSWVDTYGRAGVHSRVWEPSGVQMQSGGELSPLKLKTFQLLSPVEPPPLHKIHHICISLRNNVWQK